MQQIIERFCSRDNMPTVDPYDVWKTPLGFCVKDFFNCHQLAGLLPAAALTIFDTFVNNRARFFYSRQEYPIVRAFAALSLLNLYRKSGENRHLEFAKKHLEWLANHPSKGYSGYCWGLQFDHAVSCGLIYNTNTALSTITPYPLEAFIAYSDVTGDKQFDHIIKSVYLFLEHDVKVMMESDRYLVTSYSTTKDRVVINAVSYTMYAYALLFDYVDSDKQAVVGDKIRRLYQFVKDQQRKDGSWLYSPEGNSFIDCFHSCIVLKNIIKTDRLVRLEGASRVVNRGYRYLKENFSDDRFGLFRRFALQNKPSLVKFDLYDNAEMLNLGVLMNDRELMATLSHAIDRVFRRGVDIYSQVDCFGRRYNKNMLRWAVLPYLYVMSIIPEVWR